MCSRRKAAAINRRSMDKRNSMASAPTIRYGDDQAAGLPTYSEVFANTLVELANKNEKIVAITAAMPNGTALDLFRPHHPKRYFDVGIAEEHAVVFAAGMATRGYRPVCAIYSTFLQRAFDPIIHDVCLQKLPVTFCMDRAGLSGDDGPTITDCSTSPICAAFLRSCSWRRRMKTNWPT